MDGCKFYVFSKELSAKYGHIYKGKVDKYTVNSEQDKDNIIYHAIKNGAWMDFSEFLEYMTGIDYSSNRESVGNINAFIEFIRKAQETPESNAFAICDENGILYEPMNWLKEQGLIKEEPKKEVRVSTVAETMKKTAEQYEQEYRDSMEKANVNLYANITIQELPARYNNDFKLAILHEAVYLLTKKIKSDAEVPFDVLKDAEDTERLLNEPF